MVRRVLLLALIALLLAPLGALPGSHASAASAPLLDTHAPAPAPAPAPARLVPGSTAIVDAEGDCLRLRAEPQLAGEEIACIEHGAEVRVLEGTFEADGYTWQRIQTESVAGWAADLYLVPAVSTPACDVPAGLPGLVGHLPVNGGWGLVVWGGGTVGGMVHAAAARGVSLRSLYVLDTGGRWVSHIVGAPSFVNRPWYEHFPGGRIPSYTALLALTANPFTTVPINLAAAGVPPPAPTAAVPTFLGGPAPTIDAASAVVVDAASGAVLYSDNPHTQLPPASLTKIVTAILAIEGSDLNNWVRTGIDYRTLEADSSAMGLLRDDCFFVLDLLYGLMLRSGNDAALAIARHVAGSDEAFVESMNALVARFGLQNTHFANPHGLHDDAQYSSAYDIAMLARYAMTLPTFADAAGAHAWTAEGSRTIGMRTINAFLTSYDDADGVKTGFTEEAGMTLVASATRDGKRVFAVLFNAPNRSSDAAALLDWAFDQHVWPE